MNPQSPASSGCVDPGTDDSTHSSSSSYKRDGVEKQLDMETDVERGELGNKDDQSGDGDLEERHMEEIRSIRRNSIDAPLSSSHDKEPVGGFMARVLSRTSSKHFDPGPPPDGGWKAWVAGT